MDWTAYIGPAVIAASISAIVSVIGFRITTATSKQLHREKLQFEEDMSQRRFDFEKDLAERKFQFDRQLIDWKRRTDFAEQVLSDFYKARDLFAAARSPFAFAGEGATRPGRDQDAEGNRESRDAIYAPYERLSKNLDFFSELHARRYRFMALFGAGAVKPYNVLVATYNEIGTATRILLDQRRAPLKPDHAEKQEAIIGWASRDDDPIASRLDEAIAEIESICRNFLLTTI